VCPICNKRRRKNKNTLKGTLRRGGDQCRTAEKRGTKKTGGQYAIVRCKDGVCTRGKGGHRHAYRTMLPEIRNGGPRKRSIGRGKKVLK